MSFLQLMENSNIHSLSLLNVWISSMRADIRTDFHYRRGLNRLDIETSQYNQDQGEA
jgi:hypothetical protein